jgi:hypothetical protein
LGADEGSCAVAFSVEAVFPAGLSVLSEAPEDADPALALSDFAAESVSGFSDLRA